ncbi:LOW QUALITY PROTEIN: fibrous sheath-interacting protein 1 [Aulostomus maculatus]
MEIIRGSLDDISRPASSEQTGSRLSSVSLLHSDRHCPTTPFSLEVLTKDASDLQGQSSSEVNVTGSPEGSHKGQGDFDKAEDKMDDLKLQRAIEEMRRLDAILSANICKVKEVKHQRKQLQAKLWQELLDNMPEGRFECAHEAMNTRLFLALEAPNYPEEETAVVPVFQTQIPECEQEREEHHMGEGEKRPDGIIESLEAGDEETGVEQSDGSHCGASKAKQKQRDFVKRNIELVSGEGGQVLLTQAEKERLAALLREIDEDEEDGARGADREDNMWAVSVLTSQGYTPLPSDLEQLIDVDSKMRLLLPSEEFLLMQSSHTNVSPPQVHSSEVGWRYDGDPEPGEKVLQDMKERKVQERRLQEIQQQLENLNQSQGMTSPDLCEEQLLRLLDACELTDWSQDLEMNSNRP